jgi:hypothetical protein
VGKKYLAENFPRGLSFNHHLVEGKVIKNDITKPKEDNNHKRSAEQTLSPFTSFLNALTNKGYYPEVDCQINVNNVCVPAIALFDTGADTDNFISDTLATQLEDEGLRRSTGGDTKVCSCFDECRPTKGHFVVELHITDRGTPPLIKKIECTLKVLEFNKNFNIIIGKPTLLKNNLLEYFTRLEAVVAPIAGTTQRHDRKKLERDDRLLLTKLQNMSITQLNALTHHSDILDKEDDGDEDIGDEPFTDLPDYTASSLSDEEILSRIRIEGRPEFAERIKQVCRDFIDVLRTEVKKTPAKVSPMKLRVDEKLWISRRNRQSVRIQTRAKSAEIEKQITAMLRLGVIEPSSAGEYSQVHLTSKPGGKWRFCIDFRYLNLACLSEGWPIPNIEQMLDRLGQKKGKYWGIFDLTAGYHQAPLHKDSRAATAFITHMGLYQWKRVAMGLKAAGSFFQQRMAAEALRDLMYQILEIYLDDIITPASTEDEFIQNITEIFQALRDANITVNPDKLKLGMPSVEFVGHVIDEHGKHFTREKLSKVMEWVMPTSQRQMKSFLGVANYFRGAVRKFVDLATPLSNATRNYSPLRKIEWTEEMRSAFVELKLAIDQCPILAWLLPGHITVLCTDACQYGVGGYLYQLVNGKEVPIAFVSKALSPTQIHKWSTIEKEGYAIFYCLTKLQYLLRDMQFLIRTDHKNLTWKFLNTESNARVKRWKIAIQDFDFQVDYIEGPRNIVADGLSRMPHEDRIENGKDVSNLNVEQTRRLEYGDISHQESPSHSQLSIMTTMGDHTPNIPPRLEISDLNYALLASCHNAKVGHAGVETMVKRLSRILQQSNIRPWKFMRQHVKQFIKECACCQKMATTKLAIQVMSFTTARIRAMECWNIDTIGPLTPDADGNTFIIVVIDMFTRWVELKATNNTTAATAAEFLFSLLGRYGIPKQILTDNGTQYQNDLIKRYCTLTGIEQLFVLAYSKEENGLVERANGSVMRHLKNLVQEREPPGVITWSARIPIVQRIMNSSVHQVLGTSPQQLLYGNALDLDNRVLLPTEEILIGQEVEATLDPTISVNHQNLTDILDPRNQEESSTKEIPVRKEKSISISNPGHLEDADNSHVLDHHESQSQQGIPLEIKESTLKSTTTMHLRKRRKPNEEKASTSNSITSEDLLINSLGHDNPDGLINQPNSRGDTPPKESYLLALERPIPPDHAQGIGIELSADDGGGTSSHFSVTENGKVANSESFDGLKWLAKREDPVEVTHLDGPTPIAPEERNTSSTWGTTENSFLENIDSFDSLKWLAKREDPVEVTHLDGPTGEIEEEGNVSSSLYATGSKKIAASNEIRNWFAELLAFQERAILVAAGNQMAKDDAHMRQGSQTQTRYDIDSLVLISYPPTSHGRGPPSRFSPPQRGPFIVKEVNGNRIIVEGINDGKREEHLILNVRPFFHDPRGKDPKAVALTDKDMYIVERIISHKGDKKLRGKMTFRVKWEGEEQVTTEPYSLLRDNEKLHEYLKKKNLTALIPKKFNPA